MNQHHPKPACLILMGIPASFFALRPKQPFRALGRILPEPVGKNTLTEDLAASVATLPRTSLDAMDAVQLMRRFDTKYVLPESWLPDLFETMAPHAHVLEVDGGMSEPIRQPLFRALKDNSFKITCAARPVG